MALLECPRCGYRRRVPGSEVIFGLDCLECGLARMGPPRERPPPGPLGGVGRLPMRIVRPLMGAPLALALLGAVSLVHAVMPGGLWLPGRLGMRLAGLLIVMVVVGLFSSVVGVVRLVRFWVSERKT